MITLLLKLGAGISGLFLFVLLLLALAVGIGRMASLTSRWRKGGMQAETALKAFGEWAVQTWKVGAAFIKNPGA